MKSALSHLECSRCNQVYEVDKVANLCRCGAPLLPRYDLQAVRRSLTRTHLLNRPPTMWRYQEVLPVRDRRNVVTLGEGYTPLLQLPRLASALGMKQLLIKDESPNPGGTFKARGAATGVSRAVELGIRSVAIATNGNAGEAWALYGARAGIETIVIMPVDAQLMPQKICALSKARTYLVKGLISDAGKIVQRGVRDHGWFDACTLKEPYRIEGKKTVGYELLEQMDWTLPDVILCPSGGGMLIAALYKAFLELRELGWWEGPLPRLVAVQSEGCRPLVDAFHAGATESKYHDNATTFANGLRVPKSVGDFMVLEALRKTGGTAVTVTDDEIRAAILQIGELEGIFLCPEAAAVIPGLHRLLQSGLVSPDERVAIMGTGSGVKYPDTVPINLEVLDSDATL